MVRYKDLTYKMIQMTANYCLLLAHLSGENSDWCTKKLDQVSILSKREYNNTETPA